FGVTPAIRRASHERDGNGVDGAAFAVRRVGLRAQPVAVGLPGQPVGDDLGRHRPGPAQHRRRAGAGSPEGAGSADVSFASLEEADKVGMTLAWFAAEAPDRSAVISEVGDRTFGSLNARANQLVRALRA